MYVWNAPNNLVADATLSTGFPNIGAFVGTDFNGDLKMDFVIIGRRIDNASSVSVLLSQ